MGRPRKFDEREVVVAARRQFNETGFHGTSVDELSRATGLSKGSLYGAFGDKEGLFRRVFDDYCAGTDEGAASRLEGPEDEALDRARDWLRTTARSTDPRGCLLAKGTAELASENPAVAARANAAYTTLLAGCRGLIEQAQRAGRVDPGADAAALGGVLLTTQRGLEALGRAGVDPSVRLAIADATIDGIAASRPSG
ncbi:TetR/AcrR family transcriptional regulator [Patulibacter minatonensis]|uniref:TetR/AcrR family transcriptional regulator n=1 Tax=Patulibacter minatonensis TaxID=298163 RepID=UPI00047D651F|nr:TetR/AcrR family transcriptional regulator [Patulibacter minatonensis]